MDADNRERRRNISQREKRWSMNSQRLEEIVAELMKPISDVRRSFDTDLSALLEEYLTEAGLHALDAEEEEGSASIPNFAELALLLQQSASIYSRKVDFLYQHVLNVSESLHNSTQEAAVEASTSAESPTTPSRRKRKASVHEGFSQVPLEPSSAARRDAGQPRPPPTLPRLYVELEPRVLAACDAPLTDYAGEPIGLLADFHVTWRLQEGLLVEELAGGGISESTLRALPLTELQAAIEAAAPPSPPPCFTPPCSPPPPASSTPLPAVTETPPPDKRERKRRSDVDVDHMDGTVKLVMNKKLRRRLARLEEFSVPSEWVRRVVRARKHAVLAARRSLTVRDGDEHDFRGFDISDSIDVGGFVGWSSSEAGAALGALEAAAARRADDSDDDGFFEQSSLGDSDTSRADDPATTTPTATTLASLPGTAEWSEWRERVVSRAAAAEARGVDIQHSAGALLAATQELPPCSGFDTLLTRTASDPSDVSKLFLATLFLANAGNVEIVQGPPLTLNTFSVRLVSTDERLYRTAAAADEQFLR